MPLLKVGPVQSLLPGDVTEVENGGRTFAVCNVEGQIFCVDGICPHLEGPLGQGTLNGKLLVCPWHGWEFDCSTGVNDLDTNLTLQTFPIVVQNDEILIDLPQPLA